LRKAAFILLLALMTSFLSGCFDASEIDDLLQVSAIGVDKGVKDKWRVTIQFPTIKNGGGGGSGEGSSGGGGGSGGDSGGGEEELSQEGYTVVSIDAPSFYEALEILDASNPREINFMQTQVIVFSEEIAKMGIMGEFLSPLARFREIRRSAFLLVTKGKAFDFIKENKPYVGLDITKNYRIWIEESRDSGYFPYVTIGTFYEKLKSPKSQAIATLAAVNDFSAFVKEGESETPESTSGGRHKAGEIPRISENKIELWGTALFDEDVLVGELNGAETRCLLMLRNEFTRGVYTVPDLFEEGLIVVLEVRRSKPTKVKVKFVDNIPQITVKVFLNGDILSIQGSTQYEQKENKPLLEDAFAQLIKAELKQLVDKCQKLNVDAMKFGLVASKRFLTIDELVAYDWNNRFSEAIIDVDVEFTIRRTGKLIRSGPLEG